MDTAVEVLKRRAKAEGRGRVEPNPKAAAVQLRDERLARIATDFGIKTKTLRNRLKGKRGASRR